MLLRTPRPELTMHVLAALVCLLGGLALYIHAMVKNGDFLVQTEIWTGGVIAIIGLVWMIALMFGVA